MKPLRFRFKIVALSLLMSGLLVVGFGVFFLVTISRVGMERIDNEIRALGEAQVRARLPVSRWSSFDSSLHFIYGDQPTQRFAVRVLDADGHVLFTSEQWPAELTGMKVPELRGPPPAVAQGAGHVVAPTRGPGPGGTVRPEDRASNRRRFIQRLDKDGDGRVSVGEFDGPPNGFAEFDRNTDGYISTDEVPAQLPGLEWARDDQAGDREHPPADALTRTDAPQPSLRPKTPVFETHETSLGAWRVGFMGNQFVTLIVAADLAAFHRETIFFRNAFLIATPVALVILGFGGWIVASRALRPVALITRTAKAITARDLHRRIPATNSDAELQRLVDVINGMLERLERGFHQAARFSADAAHELQTPLTVLQGELDNAMQQAGAGSEEQQRYSDLLEEVRRLKAIVQKLLLLARADVGQLPLSLEDVDLSALIQASVEDAETIAPHLTIEADFSPGIRVKADADLIGQAIRNMMSNAVKYNQDKGVVRFRLSVRDATVAFTLANRGTAIPAEDRERIFDRFYRLDKARSREVPGSGLGLGLAREIARAHGGDLILDPDTEGMTSFTLTLPRDPA